MKDSVFNPLPLNNIKYTLAVASGKGGVGKSTTAVNLAFALKEQGFKVGILDADIYGPSLPTLLNIKDKPELAIIEGQKKIIPLLHHGVTVMSMGFLVEQESPIIWRGLMIQQAVKQFINDVFWERNGPLDYLIVDLPPGTGDVQLTLVQKLKLSGAVVVTTPQDLALIDAKRAYQMFKKTDVPIFGFIENMSCFKCPHCAQDSYIFGTSTLKTYADQEGVPFLGQIPLHIDIRKTSDDGVPIVIYDKENAISKIYHDICQKLKDTVNVL